MKTILILLCIIALCLAVIRIVKAIIEIERVRNTTPDYVIEWKKIKEERGYPDFNDKK